MSKNIIRRAPKRPIEKIMLNSSVDAVGTTQNARILHTTTVAETLSGIRASLETKPGADTSGRGLLLLVVVRDGRTAETILTADNSIPYEPEQEVLWIHSFYGLLQKPLGPIVIKSMRKLKNGDMLQLLALSTVADGFDYTSTWTMFFKQ